MYKSLVGVFAKRVLGYRALMITAQHCLGFFKKFFHSVLDE